MGVGTGPAGPAAAGPKIKNKNKNSYKLTNKGIGNERTDQATRLSHASNYFLLHPALNKVLTRYDNV